MEHSAGSIPDLHPGFGSLGGRRDRNGFLSQDEWFVCCCWLSLAVPEVGTGVGRNLVPGCCHLRVLAKSTLALLLFASSFLS